MKQFGVLSPVIEKMTVCSEEVKKDGYQIKTGEVSDLPSVFGTIGEGAVFMIETRLNIMPEQCENEIRKQLIQFNPYHTLNYDVYEFLEPDILSFIVFAEEPQVCLYFHQSVMPLVKLKNAVIDNRNKSLDVASGIRYFQPSNFVDIDVRRCFDFLKGQAHNIKLTQEKGPGANANYSLS